jgi:hypothetical protein
VAYDHPKLNQKDISYLSRSITSNETEAALESPKIEIRRLWNSSWSA